MGVEPTGAPTPSTGYGAVVTFGGVTAPALYRSASGTLMAAVTAPTAVQAVAAVHDTPLR
jgi:hypothetical protein